MSINTTMFRVLYSHKMMKGVIVMVTMKIHLLVLRMIHCYFHLAMNWVMQLPVIHVISRSGIIQVTVDILKLKHLKR